MGVIVKYLIDFPDAKFKVSNDLLQGDFLIDVSVRVSLMPGAAGSTFEVQLIDLPEKKAKILTDPERDLKKSRVTIKLGYFDDPFATVLEGLYTEAQLEVKGDTLLTTLTGEESATYALNRTKAQKNPPAGKISIEKAATQVLADAFPDGGAAAGPTGLAAAAAALLGGGNGGDSPIDKTPIVQNVKGDLESPSFQGKPLMKVLTDLARIGSAELLVYDKKVRLGKPITNDDYKPAELNRNVNLAVFRPFAKVVPEDQSTNRIGDLPAEQALGFHFTIAGDPKLRPANKVFADVEGYRKKDGVEFRVLRVDHTLSVTGGYVCQGVAVKALSDDNSGRQQAVIAPASAEDVALRLAQRIQAQAGRQPVVEVCAVKDYQAGGAGANPHRATLFFNQHFDKAETQPSVRAPVDADATQVFANKPVVAPFAWHKCGLVTPVYAGMKAVVAHNLGLTDDGLVAGFIWSEQPKFDAPQSQAGDWWLCLPVNFDSTQPPTDSTSAANDLIANNGHRVIEVSGLRIRVGKAKLGTVGTRPTEGKDDEILIEHKPSGTTVTIDANGGLTIDCKDSVTITCKNSLKIKANSVSIEGDVSVQGNLDVK